MGGMLGSHIVRNGAPRQLSRQFKHARPERRNDHRQRIRVVLARPHLFQVAAHGGHGTAVLVATKPLHQRHVGNPQAEHIAVV